ncbi:MAG: aminotransferase class I/II-fold pyridoxal phosphate-dependent enzyme [Desulfatibacillaceae bacterium]|nr:aminotransferase class I/II-fold pyridoxal phosphate-dependent enzyme [Desulfatibacillaceae bacterium]
MENRSFKGFDTKAIHSALTPEKWQGATLPPIFQTAANYHPTASSLNDAFAGRSSDHIYMRLSNPTNRLLEEKLCALEGGKGAVVMASGMAAIANSCMALLRAGDEFVAGNSLFMSSYVLFANIFKKYNLACCMVEPTDLDAVRAAINEKTRFLYIETIGNPKMDVPDIEALAKIAHEEGIPLIVDNTLATPCLCRPLELGADVVLHSTTKYLSGHGCATGGAVVDAGRFDWSTSRFADFAPFVERKGPLAFLDRVWREHHINFGTTQAPFHSYLTVLGMDTLGLRVRKHSENALAVASFLAQRPGVRWVNYPGLAQSPSHATAKKQFDGKGFGGLLTLGLADKEKCFAFIDSLKLITHLANLGDCKTLVIHPSSTQYVAFAEELKLELGVLPDLIRLSVGIEDIEDIIADIDQALVAIGH